MFIQFDSDNILTFSFFTLKIDTQHQEVTFVNVRHSLKFELRIGLEKEYIDINITGDTPLHWAAWYGKTETVAVLIRHGADLTVTNNEGNTFSFV